MMFAAFTSAYIVKRQQPGWTTFDIPVTFWYSTAVIILSSLSVQLAVKAFKQRSIIEYRRYITATSFLGLVFILLQFLGFKHIWNQGVTFKGSGAGQFLYIIAGIHAVHVLGGIIALLVLFIKAFNRKIRNYNTVPIEVASTYWHFVDILWVYLFIFFLVIH
ncbi:MAG: cytochrome c oxidase subunit 3 [Bacteroidetes bacterium]|nr:cytochrome c oxidase subunit 3 [Bacteroidota bacterium]MBS1932569.1 cytochrome c oxidase subunit 3 [Bacteroidota bacterium]